MKMTDTNRMWRPGDERALAAAIREAASKPHLSMVIHNAITPEAAEELAEKTAALVHPGITITAEGQELAITLGDEPDPIPVRILNEGNGLHGTFVEIGGRTIPNLRRVTLDHSARQTAELRLEVMAYGDDFDLRLPAHVTVAVEVMPGYQLVDEDGESLGRPGERVYRCEALKLPAVPPTSTQTPPPEWMMVELRKVADFVSWDRWTDYDGGAIAFGWIARTDGHRDFVQVEFVGQKLSHWSTSSAKHTREISIRLQGHANDHADCKVVGPVSALEDTTPIQEGTSDLDLTPLQDEGE